LDLHCASSDDIGIHKATDVIGGDAAWRVAPLT
jgi:hypothetical protein